MPVGKVSMCTTIFVYTYKYIVITQINTQHTHSNNTNYTVLNELLLALLCQELSTPSLRLENFSAPKQFSHKCSSKVGSYTLCLCTCTCLYLYGYVFSELNVVEVAHDHQAQIMKYITEDLQLINSYDTWHGE